MAATLLWGMLPLTVPGNLGKTEFVALVSYSAATKAPPSSCPIWSLGADVRKELFKMKALLCQV